MATNLVGQEASFDYPGFDYAAQRTRIARKLALANALQQQSLQPLETNRMAGGWAVPISPLEGLAKLAQTYVSAKAGKGAQTEQEALAKQAQGDYAKALSTALANSGVSQDDINALVAAGSNPMAAQQMPFLTGIVQQKRQMKLLQDWLGGGGGMPSGGQNGAPSAPPVGTGTVLAPGAQGVPQGPAAPAGGTSQMPSWEREMLAGGLLQIPALTEVGKTHAELSKLVPGREGGLYDQQGNMVVPPIPKPTEGQGTTFNPATRQWEYYPMPGAQNIPQFAGQVAGAVEQAKTQNSLHPVQQASGAIVPTPGYKLMPPPAAPQPLPIPQQAPQVQPPVPSAGVPPQSQTYPGITSAADEAAIWDRTHPNAPPPGSVVSPAAPQVRAAPGGRGPIADPWQTVPKVPTFSGVGQSTIQKGISENIVAADQALTKEHSEIALQANQRMATNNQALDLVDQADVGPGSKFIANMKNILVSRFGVPESDFKNTPSATIALNKDLTNAALQKGKQLFGARFTQSEVGIMLNQAAPSPEQTKAAIKFLLQSDNATNAYQLRMANDLGRYRQMGGDPRRFNDWYAQAFPMTKALEGVQLGKSIGAAPNQGLQFSPDEIEAEMRRRGLK